MPRPKNPYYSGPVSDHFDGERFFNPGFLADRTMAEGFRLLFRTKRASWPRSFPSPFRDRPPAEVNGTGLRVTLIGHASYLIQTAGMNILADPVFATRASPIPCLGPIRFNPPGIRFRDMPKIHAVLITHNHYDHLDTAALKKLRKRDQPRVIAPLGNDAIIRASDRKALVETYDWGQRVELAPGLAVTPVQTLHWSARGTGDRRMALWASFVIETPAGRIYHVGDSGYADGHHFRAHGEKYGPFRLALLPIGAYEPRWFMADAHMNPEEAVTAMIELGAEQAIGHHWGTFRLTAEAIDAPEKALAVARTAKGLAEDRFVAFHPGQVLEI